MSSLTALLGRVDFSAPRLTWRRVLARVAALDAFYRERNRMIELDDRILRDIGVSRGDVAGALDRPEEHMRLILLRRGHQFED